MGFEEFVRNRGPAGTPSDPISVDVGASVLPSGAATSANQTNGNQIARPYLVDEYGVNAQMLGDNLFAGSPVIIESEHHEIHCGDSYTVCRTADLTNGAVDTIIINVPNETGTPQKNYHTVITIVTEAEVQFDLYEGATTAADGTGITAYNRNRNSALTTGLTFFHTPTTPAGGTLICSRHWGTGRNSGGDSRGMQEFILKNNTKYRLVLTNATATNNYISWEIDHYVHPGV